MNPWMFPLFVLASTPADRRSEVVRNAVPGIVLGSLGGPGLAAGAAALNAAEAVNQQEAIVRSAVTAIEAAIEKPKGTRLSEGQISGDFKNIVVRLGLKERIVA